MELLESNLSDGKIELLESNLSDGKIELLESNLSDGKIELLDLPSELIPQYALELPLQDLMQLCGVSKAFNEIICQNEYFWKMKFLRDFKFIPETVQSWHKIYRNYNSLWGFGRNSDGQLGIKMPPNVGWVRTPTEILVPFKVKSISTGGHSSIIIDMDKNVWSSGDGYSGQLGLGDKNSRSSFTQIPNLKAKAVSMGFSHTMVIDLSNDLWGFGENWNGELGLGDKKTRYRPTKIPGLKAKAVSAGRDHTAVIDLNDNLWTFGAVWIGRTDKQKNLNPVMMDYFKVKAVAAGSGYTLVIDMNDDVWAFGENYRGQLGLGDTRIRLAPAKIPGPESPTGSREPSGTRLSFKAKSIFSGGASSAVIDFDDNIWVFGSNESGKLGLGDTIDRLIPTIVPNPEPSGAGLFFKAKTVSLGSNHTLMIDLEENLWGSGRNDEGELGLGWEVTSQLRPVQIPRIKASAVATGKSCSIVIGTMITSSLSVLE